MPVDVVRSTSTLGNYFRKRLYRETLYICFTHNIGYID